MFIANLATIALSNVSTTAAWLFQEQAVGWDPTTGLGSPRAVDIALGLAAVR